MSEKGETEFFEWKDEIESKFNKLEELLRQGYTCLHNYFLAKEVGSEKELYELYLKDKGEYYFRKTTHPFTELNNMVHLSIGEVVATREDLRDLIEAIHEGYGDEQPAMVEMLERIEEAYGLE